MSSRWLSLLFETCESGVSSARAPELLPDNQVAWGMNIDVRGGKPATRPNLKARLTLPGGLIQGAEYFSVQNGMIVASIAGRIYRLRINANTASVEEIPLGFVNSPIIKQVWMQQTVETLVIQDGQSNAILYDGATALRSIGNQVPRGRQMGYGNGRLWVAVNENEVLAGDIRTGVAGSELLFTEATYLTGGGKLFFSRNIKAMAFIPVTGQSDYGVLLIFGAGETNAIRADITARDDWGKIPGFVTSILRSVGAACHWSIVSVNQDLYWRDSNGGIRSIRNALADEAGPGSAPISREVSRLTDFDSQRQLAFCSGVYFKNRLLMTSSPFLLKNGGVGFKDLISLDYAPLSSMGGKSQPAYNGQWNGLNFVKLVGGEFAGKSRAFVLATDDDGGNQLWEFETGDRADIIYECGDGTSDGTSDPARVEHPICCFVEYPLRNFGAAKARKLLQRCDVWLSAVNGEIDLKVYWRADNSVQWKLWDEAETCAQTSDPAVTSPHVWKNLYPQERPQFKTFTIPDNLNGVTNYENSVGFEFQIRLVWCGRLRIHRLMVYGSILDDPDYADRSGFEIECVQNDIQGNEVIYRIPLENCAYVGGLPCGGSVDIGEVTEITDRTYTITNIGFGTLELGVVTVSGAGFSILTQPETTSLLSGESTTFTVRFDPEEAGFGEHIGTVDIPSNDPNQPCTFTSVASSGVGLDFDQGDGPFIFPPGAFTNGYEFFTQQLISGFNAQKYIQIAADPNDYECTAPGSIGNPPAGRIITEFGGLVTYNINTATYTGELWANLSREGILPGIGSNTSGGPTQYITALSIGDLFANIADAGGAFGSQYYFEYTVAGGYYFRKWISLTPAGGYYVSGFMNAIYCPGFVVTALTQ